MTDVDLIRKAAFRESGRSYFEDEVDAVGDVLQAKMATAEDRELLEMAEGLPGDTLEVYEALGGKYKTAFGQPMFQATQTATPGMAAPSGGGAGGAMRPAMAKPGMGGAAMPGMGGAGGGSTNPVQQASTPKIPGTGAAGGGGA